MLLRTIFCIACIAVATTSKAQWADLLRDPDVTWVAEHTTDYLMDLDRVEEYTYDDKLNYLDLVKFLNSENQNGLVGLESMPENYLSQQCLKAAQKAEFFCFKDSLCQNIMTPAERHRSLTKTDTVIGCCDCPLSDMYRVITNDVSIEEVWCFRVRQIFWYDRKREVFDTRLLAYGPVVFTRDNEGNTTGTRTLFWVKANELPQKEFKNRSFNYVFQTKMLNNAPTKGALKVLKGTLDFKKFFAKELSFPSHPLISASNYQMTSSDTLSADCFGTDTIISYLPSTYEEIIQLESRNCIEQIERIRFVQNWYYDERKHRLYTRLVGVSPLAAIRDSEGNFRYFKPLFYQVYR